MLKIRDNFETNSSSCHVLTIANEQHPFQPLSYLGNKEGDAFQVLGNTSFGWGVELIDDAGSKANYLYLDSQGNNRARIIDIIKEHVGVSSVVFTSIEEASYPYIDHKSIGTSCEIMDKSDDEIWDFIMNPMSTILLTNDNL